jgi:hypothetical protein
MTGRCEPRVNGASEERMGDAPEMAGTVALRG